MPPPGRSLPEKIPVIVLAGGVSRRFGRDKLRALLGGKPVVAHTVERVTPLASEVVLATTSERRGRELARFLPASARVEVDQTARWGSGPGAAIASALEAIPRRPVLIVPGDVPWVETRALGRFISIAAAGAADLAAPHWATGATEHLVQWHRDRGVLARLPWRRPGASSARRASEFLRAAPRTLLVPVGALTRRGETFSHVTVPSDLVRPAVRGVLGRSSRPCTIVGTPKWAYRRGHSRRAAGELEEASREFEREALWYSSAGWPFLARHALEDALAGAPRHLALGGTEKRLGPPGRTLRGKG